MSNVLEPTSQPLLSRRARFVGDGDEVSVVTSDATYTYSGHSAGIISALVGRLNGSEQLGRLAGDAGVSLDELNATLAVLLEDGLLIDAAPAEPASVEDFLQTYFRLCKFWEKDIFDHPFWDALSSGQASRNVVLGWGIETYHYVHSANEHMAAAVAYCRDNSVVRMWLAQHYIEEHNHGDIFLNGLVESGLSRELVSEAPPLASTRALINYLNELAISDTLAYSGVFGVMQPTSGTRTRADVDEVYQPLISAYGFASGMLGAFRTHSSLDADLDHNQILLKRILEREGFITPDGARRVLRAARGVVEYFILFFDGIHDYYGQEKNPLPRRRADIRMVA
jgi:pyrroloquinoline quinone (PQQ) biosynthesis protein C